MQTKECRKCQCEKAISEFYKSPVYKDGLVRDCKSCVREYDEELKSKPRVPPESGLKTCCRCNEQKRICEFHKRSRNADGLRSECIACTRKQEHGYRQRKPDQGWRIKLKWTYGLSEEQYLAILNRQNGKCAICGNDEKKLAVDHCHTTGMIRGLLCPSCNSGLGMFYDKPEVVEKAADYLRKTKHGLRPPARSLDV